MMNTLKTHGDAWLQKIFNEQSAMEKLVKEKAQYEDMLMLLFLQSVEEAIMNGEESLTWQDVRVDAINRFDEFLVGEQTRLAEALQNEPA